MFKAIILALFLSGLFGFIGYTIYSDMVQHNAFTRKCIKACRPYALEIAKYQTNYCTCNTKINSVEVEP